MNRTLHSALQVAEVNDAVLITLIDRMLQGEMYTFRMSISTITRSKNVTRSFSS